MRRTIIATLIIAGLLSASRVDAQPNTGAASPETGSLADIEVDVTDEPEPEPAFERSGIVVVPRLGVVALGSGNVEIERDCSSSAVCESASDDADFDDDTMLLTELDVLFHLGPQLRLGGGLLWIPSSSANRTTATRSNGERSWLRWRSSRVFLAGRRPGHCVAFSGPTSCSLMGSWKSSWP